MNEDIDYIPVDGPMGEFEKFIANERNRRIFFSGKFGTGKTYFLQKFFEDNKDKYDVYHLYPARYQISSSENMVELLKYDILVELMKMHPDAFPPGEKGGMRESFKLFAAFCKDRGSINGFLSSVVSTGEGALSLSPDPLFQALSKLGRPLQDLLALDKEFQEFKKEQQEGEKEDIDKFLKSIEKDIEPIGTDYLSELLVQKIGSMKGGKKSVFIFDDFDRIDPEHIFRLLNVLSAHMDGEEENKFGFDHIIIVGDISNLKSIFHHKYGQGAEFWGYFDKFFSVKPYLFSNSKAIAERIPNLLKQIKYEEEDLRGPIAEGGVITHLLNEVLSRAFSIGEMNLRQLYKPVRHTFQELGKGVYYKGDAFSDNRNRCIDIAIKLLIALYGSKSGLLDVLQKIRSGPGMSSTDNTRAFEVYTSSMLRRMVKLNPKDTMQWKDRYSIVALQDQGNSRRIDIQLANGLTPNAGYFYDVLIEYVQGDFYQKASDYDYEF